MIKNELTSKANPETREAIFEYTDKDYGKMKGHLIISLIKGEQGIGYFYQAQETTYDDFMSSFQKIRDSLNFISRG